MHDKEQGYQQAARNLFLRSQFGEICRSLSQQQIAFMPLKGIAFLGTLYDDFSGRFIGDIDILVKPCDVLRAASLLRTLGYAPAEFRFDPIKPYNMYLNSVAMAAPGEINYTLHLHWHLLNSTWPLFMFRVDMRDVWQRGQYSGGIPYRMMDPHHLLVYLCLHAFNHAFDGAHLIEDIRRSFRYYRHRLAWESVVDVAGQWNARFPVFLGLSLAAQRACDDDDLRRILGLVKPQALSRRAQRHFDSLVRTGRATETAMAVFFLEMLKDSKQKIRFILLNLFPPLASAPGITCGKACMRIASFVRRLAAGLLRSAAAFLTGICAAVFLSP